MAPKFDNAEAIVTEARYHNNQEAARELSRDYRLMKPDQFNKLFREVNANAEVAGLPKVQAHTNAKGEIESFDFGNGDVFSTKPSNRKLEQAPAATDKKPGAQPVVSDKKPDAQPVVTDKKPGAQPVVSDKKPDAQPVVTDKKPGAQPVVSDKKPDAQPVVTDKKPDAQPVATDKKPDAQPAGTDKKPDPGVTTYNARGEKVTTWGDGTVRTEDERHHSGSVIYANKDVHTWGPKPEDNFDRKEAEHSSTFHDKKGNVITKYDDGTVRTASSDNSKGVTKYFDGHEHHWGTWSSENYDVTTDGGKMTRGKDGSAWITWKDSNSKYENMQINPDGKSGYFTPRGGDRTYFGPQPDELKKYQSI